ncbi:MAG: hypothetical protein ACT4QD_19580 [Acidobacteriota bacterium]
MPRPSPYSPERRDHAVRMVFEHAHEYPWQRAAIRSIAEKFGAACLTGFGGGSARPSAIAVSVPA